MFQNRYPFCLIEIQDAALDDMLQHRQISVGAPEAGGVLMGMRRGPHFEIVQVTTPQAEDERHRVTFVRTEIPHQRLARQIWKKSRRLHGYLGEWHTHPEPFPEPSFIDRIGWKVQFRKARQPLVHIIVGTDETRAWYCDSNGALHEASRIESE
jgi:integrative and conjugative element protein (TIGR02256 family)